MSLFGIEPEAIIVSLVRSAKEHSPDLNILFVNYGDFTTNSLNHIGGFANTLCASGHACVVAVPKGKETLAVIADPLFIPATYEELLAKPALFPDGRMADVIHAWTPREVVRRFVLAYQRQAHARLIIHLEDNEEFLLSTWFGRPASSLDELSEAEFAESAPHALSHPRRYRQFLRAADGVTVIVDSLRQFVPKEVPCAVLPPGVDPNLYHPRAADQNLRRELGLRDGERVIVFTGSNTFANEPEMRELYVAVSLLNSRGIPTRLVRAGYNSTTFLAGLPESLKAHVLDLGFQEKSKLPGLIALADVLVQPGRAGPFNDFRLPSKLPEFFFSGRPVVLPASNIGNETRAGVDAVLLQTGTPEEIADACERIFKDATLAGTLAKNGPIFARRHFDLATNTRNLAKFYDSVRELDPRPGSTSSIGGEETEITLALRALAAQSREPEAAALAADLVPLVSNLELTDPSQAARLRLEGETQEAQRQYELAKQHAENLEKLYAHAMSDVDAARQHAANFELLLANARTDIEAARQHAANFEGMLAGVRNDLGATQQQVAKAEGQLAETDLQLKLTRQHADNLTNELTDARVRLRRLEGKYAIGEKLLGAARRQLDALDTEMEVRAIDIRERQAKFDADRGAARERISKLEEILGETRQHAFNLEQTLQKAKQHVLNLQHLRDVLQLSQQHGTNLEQLRDALLRRIRELDKQCEHLTRAIDVRDAKIRTMQKSFSWRSTRYLRYLRRLLIDRWRKRQIPEEAAAPVAPAIISAWSPAVFDVPNALPVPEPPSLLDPPQGITPLPISFFHSVDEPQRRSLPEGKTRFRGWCFADDGRRLTAIRALLPDRQVKGTYGLKRTDVAGAMPGKFQAEFCGWEMDVDLTLLDTSFALEVEDDSGRWLRVSETPLRIGREFGIPDPNSYEEWIAAYDRRSTEDLHAQMEQSTVMPLRPLISVVLPVYNTPERWLRRAIDSVRAQTYPYWELCIADDASTESHVRPVLEEATRDDRRIKVVFRERNGHISEASNSALAAASGEFVALLDHDDELAPQALYEVAEAINAQPDADYLYSDEDKIDENGRRHEPYFKPDWQPDLQLGQNYTSHLSVYRTELVRAAGGFRKGYEGSQDWDLVLRAVDKTSPERIVHIPKILYHWRTIPGSTALLLSEKNYHQEAARKALGDHFERIGQQVEIQSVPGGHWRVKYPLPAEAPLVSLVIPTRDGLSFLKRCVDSILEKTTYPNFEIVIVDNGSEEPDTFAYLETLVDGSHPALAPHHTVTVLSYKGPFNFSAINNYAVNHARGKLIGLLNNDLEVINSEWLDEMAGQALRPEIGCVGAMLYYPDDTIQHAGCVLGIGGVAGHAFKNFPRGTDGKFNRARLVQNYSAVTAACLLVKRSIYDQVGGLDENDLTIAFNDVDFCLKVLTAGYRNLWTPFAELYHHESASRGLEDTPEKHARFRKEIESMMRRWNGILASDPAYNPNLTLEHEDFSLASPPRTRTREGKPAPQVLSALGLTE